MAGGVKSFKARAVSASQLYLGYVPTTNTNPLVGGMFSGHFTLGFFKVLGLTGSAGRAFVNSIIAAQTVTTVRLQSAQTDNNHQGFGIIGHTVGRVKILLPKLGLTWDNTHQVAIPGDFRVNIF